MAGPSGAFYTRPEQESCQVAGPGCLASPAFQIYCRIEGRIVRACQSCYISWQARALRDGLQGRCPKCASLRAPAVPAVPAPAAIPLAGDAALVIDRAMHAEGLTVDIRQRVLARLHRDAFWLSYARPEPAGQGGWTGS